MINSLSGRQSRLVQFSSVAHWCLTLWDQKDSSTPGFPVHHHSLTLLKLMSIQSVMPSNHLILCRSLLSCLYSFPASGSFPMSQFFTSGGQSTGVSASASVLPMNIKDWFPLGWTGWISLPSKGHSRIFSNTTVEKHPFFRVQFSLYFNSHIHTWMTTGKNEALTRWTFVGKVMSLLFNMLSRLVVTFLPGNKCLLISWLQSPSAVVLEPRKIKSVTVSTITPSICHEVVGLDAMILVYWMLSFKPTFSLSFSLSSRGSLVLLCFLP